MKKIVKSSILSLGVGVAAISMTFASAVAALAPPTGLNAGDQYRIAFVTSTARDATSSDINVYNQFVTNIALLNLDLAALGTTWTAIASTSSVDARDNTNTNHTLGTGVAIYNLGDQLVANNNADLWDGVLFNRINYNENSGSLNDYVYTGTDPTGMGYDAHELGLATGYAGHSFSTDQFWMSAAGSLTAFPLSFYGISGVLTVPSAVPLPAALPLYGAGLAIMGFMGWRKKRNS